MRQPKTEKEIRCPLEYGLSVFGRQMEVENYLCPQ